MLDQAFVLDDAANTFTVSNNVPIGRPIYALDGGDRIIGSASADMILGNTGADQLYGGLGADTLQGGREGDLLFGNQGDDQLLGQRGNDVLWGGRDNDRLEGGEGDDFLAGDAGTDTLTGGDGADAFVLDSRHSTRDRALADVITDFNPEDGDLFALTDGENDALTEADLTLITVGADTYISLTSTGAILARVLGVTTDELVGSFSTAQATLDDTESGATRLGLLPGAVNIQGNVGDADYLDFYQFQVTQTSIVNFGLSGLSADADLLLYQDFNGDGELAGDEIVSIAEQSGNADEAITNVTLDPDRYFLSVEQFEGDTPYLLTVDGVAGTVAQDLAGDRPSTARPLPADAAVELHDYVGNGDRDIYQLEVANEGYLDLFTAYQLADVDLTLWRDRNGNDQLDNDEIVAQGTNEIQLNSLNPGTYYINVVAPGDPTPYDILAIASAGSRVGIENYDPLFPGIPTTGTLAATDAFDPNDPTNYADAYLLPELVPGATVTLTEASNDFDAYLTVVDLNTGEVIAENDDIDTANGNFDAQVSFTTALGGQYVVFASSVDAPGLGDYTLQATLTGTPVPVAHTSPPALALANPLASYPRVADNAAALSPPPVFNEQGNRADTGLQQDTVHTFVYQPLDGGQIVPISLNNLNQGGFGDCAFLAALAATFGKIEDPGTAATRESPLLNSAVTSDGSTFTLRFYNYQTGQPRTVTVDNQVVTKDNTLFGADWDNAGQVTPGQAPGQPIWAPIFERAYAAFRGEETGRNGYDVMGNGDVGGLPLRRVTGQGVEEIGWDPSQADPSYEVIAFSDEDGSYNSLGNITPSEIFQRIQAALDQGRYVMTGTISDAERRSQGLLVGGHAYSIHNAYLDANGQPMLLVRNPWGVDSSQAAIDGSNDGFVTISLSQFLDTFSGVSLTQG